MGRTFPVRLCDIPPAVRLNAAIRAGKRANERERVELLMAALYPSASVYWVSESARGLVESFDGADG